MYTDLCFVYRNVMTKLKKTRKCRKVKAPRIFLRMLMPAPAVMRAREREIKRQRDRETENRETERQNDRKTERQKDREKEKGEKGDRCGGVRPFWTLLEATYWCQLQR